MKEAVSPAENSKDQVEHEEGSDHNERHKVDPVEVASQSIISLFQKENVDRSMQVLTEG